MIRKDSLDTVGFRTCVGGSRVLNQKVTFGVLNVPGGGEGVTGLGQGPKIYRFLLVASPNHIFQCPGPNKTDLTLSLWFFFIE